MTAPVSFVVSDDEGGTRLDRLVARHTGSSRRVARILIMQGKVCVRRTVVKIATREIRAGEQISVSDPGEVANPKELPKVEPRILHLDHWLVAVDKPAGLLSETGRQGSPSIETLVPRLLAEAGEHKTDVRLVHRLDAGTSGVLLLARRSQACATLGDAFAQGRVTKTYIALCQGNLGCGQLIDAPIGPVRGTRQGVVEGGKPARTQVESIATTQEASLVRAQPKSGRTHQIRVHLAHLGHPLYGDGLYDGPRYVGKAPPEPVPRTMLHALQIEVTHPKTGEPLLVRAPPPEDFVALAMRLGVWPEGGI